MRTTKVTQAKYLTSLEENESGLKQFISSVTGTCKIGDKNLQMQMIYLMPYHPRLVKDDWDEIAKNNGIHGIIFYKKGYVTV